MAKIYHSEIFGLREKKYSWLEKHDISKTKWKKIKPQSEFYLFIPRNEELENTYNRFHSIKTIFNKYSLSIQTHRDNFAFDFNKNRLIIRLKQFADLTTSTITIKETFNLKDTGNWKVELARKKMRTINLKENIYKCLYRIFDERWLIYNDIIVDRTRKEIMQHMIFNNVSMLISRQQSILGFYHIFITDIISESCVVSNKTKEGNYHIPLYLYPETDKKHLFSETESKEKKPNINPEIFEQLQNNFKKEATPEEIFYYIYAILYSKTYRTKYAEFLKIDFPRIPFTKNYKLFIKLGKLGKRLADLHLLKSKELDKPIAKFPVEGDNKVDKPVFKDGNVYINKGQYFSGVTEEVWNYQIGGYQVCEKWLKDRKKRTLSLDEIQTYCKIITALSKTIDIQKEIDELYDRVEG